MLHSFFSSLARSRYLSLFSNYVFLLLLFYYLYSFLLQHWLIYFLWSLSNNKSPHVSRTIISILADLNVVIWIASTRRLISKFTSACTYSLVTAPSVPITIGITVTFMLHRFYSSVASSRYLSLFWRSLPSG